MEISSGTAKEISDAKKEINPSNPPSTRMVEADRIPMSVPNTKLGVPEIPGFHLHWFLERNVNRALRASYAFVETQEVDVNQHGVANDRSTSGSTDMGTRVSLSAGQVTMEDGNGERLFLMKLRSELRAQDVAALEARNEKVAAALRAGTTGAENDPDIHRRYMKAGQDLFVPKNRPRR